MCVPGTDAHRTDRHKPVFLSSSPYKLRLGPGTGNMSEVEETQANRDTFKVLGSTGAGHGSRWWI